MAKIKNSRFKIFRYQLLPIDRFQGSLLDGAKTVDELIEKKNSIFEETLKRATSFSSGRTKTKIKLMYAEENFLIYRLAVNRSINRELEDFGSEELDNWPSILVAVWNDPSEQIIAVQDRPAAFQHPSSVVKLIFEAVQPALRQSQLVSVVEPIFDKKIFWDLIERHEGKIESVKFEIITPNMANISKVLAEDLKQFAKSTNSIHNTIEIKADKSSALSLEKDNATLAGLVEYSAQGGGNISMRIAKIKKIVSTSKSSKEIEIEDVVLNGKPEEIALAFKELLA